MSKTLFKFAMVSTMLVMLLVAVLMDFGSYAEVPNDGVLEYRISDDGSYYIIDGVVSNKLVEVNIPSTYNNIPVKEIGKSAFKDCNNLVSVNIPTSIVKIGETAFKNCGALSNIELPNSISNIGNSAFHSCSSLTAITIPDSIRTIEESTFNYCANLSSILIPDGVEIIGSFAFNDCYKLESVSIPASVTDIGYCAFGNCENLKSVHITDVVSWCNISFGIIKSNPLEYADNLYINGEFVKNLIIPEGVTNIAAHAFTGYSSLASITIPSSVKSIGYEAFKDCVSIKDVYIEDLSAWINISFDRYNATPLTYASNLYLNGELVENVEIPKGVTNIGAYAFYGYKTLSSVTFHEEVASIGNCAFTHCVKLADITIPRSVTNIGEYAFYDCTGLKELTIACGVKKINPYAFDKCSFLKSINFRGTVEQWNLIDKDTKWDGVSSAFMIKCIDGTISKNGVITYN